jgi:hypothetical protein
MNRYFALGYGDNVTVQNKENEDGRVAIVQCGDPGGDWGCRFRTEDDVNQVLKALDDVGLWINGAPARIEFGEDQ